MTEKKVNHSAALSQLGNLFQYLIALKCSLEAKSTDIINIESKGDLSQHDINYEIKHHHKADHCLIDSHIDLWKTLGNWVTHKEELSEYSHKILLTSSIVKEDTLAHAWNELLAEDRYIELNKLKTLFLADKSKYKSIRPHILKIFAFTPDYTQEQLIDLLKSVTIKHSQSGANKLFQELFDHPKLDLIKEKDRYSILFSLIGFIVQKGIMTPLNWDIEVSEFMNFLREQVYKLSEGEKLDFPDIDFHTQTQATENLSKNRYIEQIRKIPFESQVMDALHCYNYSINVLTRMSFRNPHSLEEFSKNKSDTGTLLNNKKEAFCLKFDDYSETKIFKQSKMNYLNSISDICVRKSYPHNFNVGLIHQYIDTSDFEWKLKESNFED